MARSDKVPFRREFAFDSGGFIGPEDGMFVGDILSLHMDFSVKSISCLLEGKIGKQGIWENIGKDSGTGHYGSVDIRSYEYIRLSVFDVTQPATVVIFGYENNVIQEEINIKYNDRDFMQLCKLTQASEDTRDLLIKLNKYMEIITGEDL